MTEEKHLDPAVADQIGEFVKLKGARAVPIPFLMAQSCSNMIDRRPRAHCPLTDDQIIAK
jgi:hypothetical protein